MPVADGTRAALVDAVVARAEATTDTDDAPAITTLVRRGLDQVTLDDLTQRSPEYLASVAGAHWRLARTRREGHAAVEVFTPAHDEHGFESVHTVVLVVTEDMPFLVESITMEIDRHGLGVHLVVHPQLAVHRDTDGYARRVTDPADADARVDSFVFVEIDRETDQHELAALHTDLVRILGDVRAANLDWREMAARMGSLADQITVQAGTVGENANYLLPEAEATVATHEGVPLYIELPTSVFLEVTYTEPGLQGDRSTGGTKPATVETGYQIQVPLFLEQGTKVKVDTRTGDYLGRVNE